MKITPLFAILVVLNWSALLTEAQTSISFETGYGFYNMKTFSKITESIPGELQFDSRIISNYPPYHYYQPMIRFSDENFYFGFVYTFQTTGSRVSSVDYSGEYRFDTKINCNSPGFKFQFKLEDYTILKVDMHIQVGLNYSVFKVNEYIRVNQESESTDYTYRANSFYFKPGLSLVYPLQKLSLEFNAGYFKEVFRNTYKKDDDPTSSINVTDKFKESDVWDGMRVGITISYVLFGKKK